jgi:hypothetical protein
MGYMVVLKSSGDTFPNLTGGLSWAKARVAAPNKQVKRMASFLFISEGGG